MATGADGRYPLRVRAKPLSLSHYDLNEEESDPGEDTKISNSEKSSKKKQAKRCQHCDRTFQTTKELKEHLSQHATDPKENPLACKICFKVFRSKDCARRHEQLHMGAKPFICEICSQGLGSAYALNEHMLKHSDERPHTCTDCHLKFRHVNSLRRHAITHNKTKLFTCSICSKTFSQMEYLKKHMLVHSGERRYLCSECPKRFLHCSDLTRHHRIHAGKRPYECPVCDMRFTDVSSRGRHLREHQHQPLGCPHCSRTFKKESLLMVHLTKEHGQKQVGKCANQTVSSTCNRPNMEKDRDERNDNFLENLDEMISPVPGVGPITTPQTETAPTSNPEIPPPQETNQAIELPHTVPSVPAIDFARTPDFNNQDFYDWLSQFSASCKMLTLPIVPEMFVRISEVQKMLVDRLASPYGVLSNRDNFGVLLNIAADLQRVLNSHLMFVYELLPT